HALPFRSVLPGLPQNETSSLPFADFRLTPHYPAKLPLDDLLRQVVPGGDEYVTEKYAFEIHQLLDEWGRGLKVATPALAVLGKFLDDSIEATPLLPTQENSVRLGRGLEVFRRRFATNFVSGRERFLHEIKTYLAQMSRVETAEFEIVGIEEAANPSPTVHIDIRYDLVGERAALGREERIGHWLTQWSRDESNGWRVRRWAATEETISRAREPIFMYIKSGVGVLDSTACALFADFENKGLQDLLVVCGSGPLLFLNQGNGKFLIKRDAFKFVRPPQGTFAHAALADFDGDGLLDIYFCLY